MKPHRPSMDTKPSSANTNQNQNNNNNINRRGRTIIDANKGKDSQPSQTKSQQHQQPPQQHQNPRRPNLTVVISPNNEKSTIAKKAPLSGSLSPTLRQSQTIGTGTNRVLLCVDNDDDDMNINDSSEEDKFVLEDSTFSSISAEMSVEVIAEKEGKEESRPVTEAAPATTPTESQQRPVSRKTKIKERFTYLKKVLPQYKIDRQMRKTIVTTMVDLNYWSDKSSGEESDDEITEGGSHQGKPRSPADSKLRSNSREEDSTAKETVSPTTLGEKINDNVSPTEAAPSSSNQPSSNQPSATVPVTEVDTTTVSLPSKTAEKINSRKSVKIYHSPIPAKVQDPPPSIEEEEESPTSKKKKKVVFLAPPIPNNTTTPAISKPSETEVPQSTARTANDLSQPTDVKERVTLIKPKQIQIPPVTQAKVAKLEKTSIEERKTIREYVVNKAVQLFIKLEKDTITTKEIKYQNLVKEKTEKQLILLKRFAMGIVEKSLKKMKNQTKERLLMRKERLIKKFDRKKKLTYQIFLFWRRCRIRKYCYFLLNVGKQIVFEKQQAEQNEHLEYRFRIAKRRIQEDQIFRDWKEEKKTAVKKQIKELKKQKQLNKPGSAGTTASLRVSSPNNKRRQLVEITSAPVEGSTLVKSPNAKTIFAPRKPDGSILLKTEIVEKADNLSDISDSEIKRAAEPTTTADEDLFSDDPRNTRPDLAPFSTMINSMIHRYLQPFPKSRQNVSNNGDGGSLFSEIPFTSMLSAKFMKSSSARIREGQSIPDPMSSEVLRGAGSTSRIGSPRSELGRRFSFQQTADSDYSFSTSSPPVKSIPPPPVTSWELNADISNLPSIQSMKQDTKYKSAAFRALEKLSNLTEHDIRRARKEVNEKDIIEQIIKQKRNHTSHLIFL